MTDYSYKKDEQTVIQKSKIYSHLNMYGTLNS